MWRFGRKDKQNGGGTAVADRPAGGDTTELFAEIERLSEANRTQPDREAERRVLELRHHAGARLRGLNGRGVEYAAPASDRLPQSDDLPEFRPEELTPELMRAAILRDGCVLVRGLVPREDALHFAAQIDRAFEERDKHDSGQPAAEGYYEEFEPEEPFGPVTPQRPWIKEGGGVLATDSPMLFFEMMEMFRNGGVPDLVRGYLGEPVLTSFHKTTLRKADPSVAGAWHQDGKFMGPVRALNLWLSLSRCGDEAPGLDIVPRRLTDYVASQTDEAMLDFQVSQTKAESAAAEGGKRVIRPIFEPGDALFFDELFLHSTGSDPSMPNPRYAIENWFFGSSSFPHDYAPVAI